MLLTPLQCSLALGRKLQYLPHRLVVYTDWHTAFLGSCSDAIILILFVLFFFFFGQDVDKELLFFFFIFIKCVTYLQEEIRLTWCVFVINPACSWPSLLSLMQWNPVIICSAVSLWLCSSSSSIGMLHCPLFQFNLLHHSHLSWVFTNKLLMALRISPASSLNILGGNSAYYVDLSVWENKPTYLPSYWFHLPLLHKSQVSNQCTQK